MVSSIFRRFLDRMYSRDRKNFETFLIVVGLFLIMVEFFNFNTNIRVCYGGCLPTFFHYMVILLGIIMAGWGVLLLNPPREEEWLVEWD